MEEKEHNTGHSPKTEPDENTVEETSNGSGDPVITGRRQSFSNVRRDLTNEELAAPGVQKIILDMLEDADTEVSNLKIFVSKYHTADKSAAVLQEKLNKDNKIDVFFGVGVGLGGAILGLTPFFEKIETTYGFICALIGSLLIIGSGFGRALKK